MELEAAEAKEGKFLLGAPTFEEIGNGRLRCVETGHELPAKEAEAYGKTKGCRLGLVDNAVAKKKPPLNMFKPDPASKSKLICKLTGYTINKTEEHIWKHITGKRFLNALERKEMEKLPQVAEKNDKKVRKKVKISIEKCDKKKGLKEGISLHDAIEGEPAVNDDDDETKICQKKNISQDDYREVESAYDDSDNEEFWVPPVGERWDFDDGKDRWDSCTSSKVEMKEDSEDGTAIVDDSVESAELSIRTKRMSIAIGPSSFASRKKKSKIMEQPMDDALIA